MSEQHTPGQWRFGDYAWHTDKATGVGYCFQTIVTDRGDCIAWVADDEGDEGRVNGQLLKAAPDLLAACKAAYRLLEKVPLMADQFNKRELAVPDMLRAAIAKARGEA